MGGEKEKTEEVLSERKGKGKNGAKETRGWKIERGFGSRKIRREKGNKKKEEIRGVFGNSRGKVWLAKQSTKFPWPNPD